MISSDKSQEIPDMSDITQLTIVHKRSIHVIKTKEPYFYAFACAFDIRVFVFLSREKSHHSAQGEVSQACGRVQSIEMIISHFLYIRFYILEVLRRLHSACIMTVLRLYSVLGYSCHYVG